MAAVVLFGAGAAVTLPATPAAACTGVNCPPPGENSYDVGARITYTTSPNAPSAGTSPGGGGGEEPYFPCGWMRLTGQEYSDAGGNRPSGPEGEYEEDGPTEEEVEEHENDNGDNGHWWTAYCYHSDEYEDVIEAWFDDTVTHWREIEEGEPPTPPIDPEILVEFAWDRLVVPDPEVHHNPEGHSYVNLKTLMWVDEAQTEPIWVQASAGGNFARVTVTPESLQLTADGTSRTCTAEQMAQAYAGGGGETDCYLTFPHSSAGYEVNATVHWSAEFDSNNGTIEGPADGVDATSDFAVEVREIQTQVTGVD